MPVFELKNPLMLDGKETTKLTYDFEMMSMKDTVAAATNLAASGGSITTAEELDPSYHSFLFAQAVSCASDGKVAVADVMRMSALDARRAASLARDFFYLQG